MVRNSSFGRTSRKVLSCVQTSRKLQAGRQRNVKQAAPSIPSHPAHDDADDEGDRPQGSGEWNHTAAQPGFDASSSSDDDEEDSHQVSAAFQAQPYDAITNEAPHFLLMFFF